VAVVTDNDKDYENNITKKYEDFKEVDTIEIFADANERLPTLEPQFVEANKNQLERLCRVIGINFEDNSTEEDISEYMQKNKTKWALKVFNSNETLNYPDYINRVITWCNEW